MKRFALVVAVSLWSLSTAVAGGIYLIPGRGAEGMLRLGDTPQTPAPSGDWIKHRKGLWYQLDASGRIALIRCERADCITDRGVQVGMQEAMVLRSYGEPRRDVSSGGSVFFQYRGIGFTLEKGLVQGVYVFVPAAKKK